MPELPEVETTRRGIAPHITGKIIHSLIVRNASLRWPVATDLPVLVASQPVDSVCRRSKYLLINLPQGALLWHLGMSGSLRITQDKTPPAKHDHIDLVFSDGIMLRFNDPRRFGSLHWSAYPLENHPLLINLGPEPLEEQFNADYLFAASRRRKQAIKTWIMDSRTVVGVGNIYANESLFYAGIHPKMATGKLSRAKAEQLVVEIKRILRYAINRGGTTLRDFVNSDGRPGYFAQELSVYGRAGEPCKRCEKRLLSCRLGQRSTYYCTHCQRYT